MIDEDSYQLFSLMTLLLDDNLIDELPCILGLVPDLQNVTFRGNLLSSPPQDILDLGWKGIKQYFNQRLQFSSTWDNNSDDMKVITFFPAIQHFLQHRSYCSEMITSQRMMDRRRKVSKAQKVRGRPCWKGLQLTKKSSTKRGERSVSGRSSLNISPKLSGAKFT